MSRQDSNARTNATGPTGLKRSARDSLLADPGVKRHQPAGGSGAGAGLAVEAPREGFATSEGKPQPIAPCARTSYGTAATSSSPAPHLPSASACHAATARGLGEVEANLSALKAQLTDRPRSSSTLLPRRPLAIFQERARPRSPSPPSSRASTIRSRVDNGPRFRPINEINFDDSDYFIEDNMQGEDDADDSDYNPGAIDNPDDMEQPETSPVASQMAKDTSPHPQAKTTGKSPWQAPAIVMECPLYQDVEPYLRKIWNNSITDEVTKAAVLALVSLPVNNGIDPEWFAALNREKPRGFRHTMSLFMFPVSRLASRPCNHCKNCAPEKRRNCRVLPPEAESMDDLQQVIGKRCVNCIDRKRDSYETESCDAHEESAEIVAPQISAGDESQTGRGVRTFRSRASAGPATSDRPSGEHAAMSMAPEAPGASFHGVSLDARLSSLVGEIGQFPAGARADLYQRIQEGLESARPLPADPDLGAQPAPSAPDAADWERKPGYVTTTSLLRNKPDGFSASLLKRGLINFEMAHTVNDYQRKLIKHLKPGATAEIHGVMGSEEGDAGRTGVAYMSSHKRKRAGDLPLRNRAGHDLKRHRSSGAGAGLAAEAPGAAPTSLEEVTDGSRTPSGASSRRPLVVFTALPPLKPPPTLNDTASSPSSSDASSIPAQLDDRDSHSLIPDLEKQAVESTNAGAVQRLESIKGVRARFKARTVNRPSTKDDKGHATEDDRDNMDDVDDVDMSELPGRTTKKSLWRAPNSLLQSPLYKDVEPFLMRHWRSALKDKIQKTAFSQLASLPKKNDIDKEWVDSVKSSHHATFKQLMSIFFHAVGSSSSSSINSILCSACETRGSLKRRNCMVLPPEAKDMRQLQEVIGQQCVNCYLCPTSKACEFPNTTKEPPAAVKQTPVPIPSLGQPAQSSSQPISRPSTADPIASSTVVHPAPLRQQESLTKSTQNLVRPVSQTPIPVPPIPIMTPKPAQPESRQSVLKQAQHVDAEQPVEDVVRQPSRLLTRSSQTSADSGSQTDREPRLSDRRTSSAAAPSPGPLISHCPSAESAATLSLRGAPSAPSKSASLVAKAFSLFGEIGQLPAEEQAGVYQKLAELSEIARRPLVDAGLGAQFPPSAPVAEDWEIAPGCLSTRMPNGPVGFSSPFLRREVISFELAHQVSRSQRVLNDYLAPLAMAKVNGIGGEEGDGRRWECTLVVLEGFVKVKVQELEARVGQGGVLLVTADSDCVVTNVGLQESKIQVRWTREW